MNELAKQENQVLSQEDIKTLEDVGVIPKGTPVSQIKFFSRVCYERQLSPFSRQLHLIKRRDNKSNTNIYTIQTGIDGLRAIAARSGEYAGSKTAVEGKGRTPIKATTTVFRLVKGEKCSFEATAYWDEFYPGEKMGFMWKRFPKLMLEKCSESLALRRGFPELAGLYTHEEMQQADGVSVTELQPKEIKSDPVQERLERISKMDKDELDEAYEANRKLINDPKFTYRMKELQTYEEAMDARFIVLAEEEDKEMVEVEAEANE